MGFLGWLVLGLIAGAIAKAIMGQDGGWVSSLIVGVVGALVGGWIGSAMFDVDLGTFWSFKTWIIAILGSILVLFVWGLITKRGKN